MDCIDRHGFSNIKKSLHVSLEYGNIPSENVDTTRKESITFFIDMFSIIIRGSIEDEDIQISSDIYETFLANVSSVLDGEYRIVPI